MTEGEDEEAEAAAAAADGNVASRLASLFLGGEAAEDEAADEKRAAKTAERDAAIKQILARGSRTLRAALGMPGETSDAELKRRALKLLQLLHPDFSINIGLKGTKKHARIEGAFKKLSVLRDASY